MLQHCRVTECCQTKEQHVSNITCCCLQRECEVYEARADRWRAVAPMHETRAYFAGVACQGSLYAMGGLSPAPNADPIYKTTLEAYDAKQDSWRTVKQPSNFLLERAFMSACVVSQA